MPSNEQQTFCNPILTENFPDPFILKVRGHYYAYSTEAEMCPEAGTMVFPIFASDDLVAWHEVGKAMPALGSPYCRYWAPEVTYHNGQFLLYYAVHTEEFKGSIRVAVANQPEGPFVDSGHDLTGHIVPWAIDPHVFRDQDGQWYLYMTIEYWDAAPGFVGSGNAVDRLIDPFTLQGTLTRVTSPAHAWQLFETKRPERGGVDWYTVEGPTVFRHHKRYYEMFSGGCYYRDNYAISYAIAQRPMGAGALQDTTWKDWEGKEGNSLLVRGDGEHMLSPGHNSLVRGPNNVDLYIAYHVLQSDMQARFACIDRLFLHGEELWTNAPTYTAQPVPALPRLREFFASSTLEVSWEPIAGMWHSEGGEAVQADSTHIQALLRQNITLSNAWLLEVNVRFIEGTGTYGIALDDTTGTIAHIVFDLSSHTLLLQGESTQTFSLPQDFVPTAYHQLLITLTGRLLLAQLDYWQPLQVKLLHTPEHFSLYTQHCSAGFSGISLTDCFRDEFLDKQHTLSTLGWREVSSEGEHVAPTPQWDICDGALEQRERDGEYLLVKDIQSRQYECGATLRIHASEMGQGGRAGLLAWYGTDGQIFVWLAQHDTEWRLDIEGRGSRSYVHQTRSLAPSFNPFTWHTLRVLYQSDVMSVWLDGTPLMDASVPLAQGECGVAVHYASAAFTNVWQTGR